MTAPSRAVMLPMARSLSACSLLLLAACTGVPDSEQLGLGEGEFGDALAYESIPDAKLVRRGPIPPEAAWEDVVEDDEGTYRGPPRIIVSKFDPKRFGDDEEDYFDGTALCPFDVEAKGFPAVTADGTTVTSFVAETLSSSDGEDELNTVAFIDVETGRAQEVVVVNGDEFGGLDFEIPSDHCRKLWRNARRVAAEVNDRFAQDRWHGMEPLNVEVDDPYGYGDDDDQAGEPSPHQRNVELIYQHREAIFRIPGVKVLARQAMDWNVPTEDACSFDPYISKVFQDRSTGVVAIEVSQASGPCFCYSETLYYAMRVPQTVFVELDKRNVAQTELADGA